MEKSLLKQALNIGMDEGWTIRLLPGGEAPLWRARSRESSVPLEDWLTGTTTVNVYKPKANTETLGRILVYSTKLSCFIYLWMNWK